MLWAVVLLALLSAVFAATAPLVMQANDLNRVVESADILRSVAEAVDSFNLVVKRGGASWTTPNNLTQLTTTIVNGQAAGCSSQTFNGTAVTNWTANAPFGLHFMTSSIWTPIGMINNLPSRSSTTIGTQRTSTSDPYFLQIEDVDVKLARLLDAYVDHVPGQAADTVRYTNPAADSTVTLSYDVTLAHLPAC